MCKCFCLVPLQLADAVAAVALYMAVKDYNKQVVRSHLFCLYRWYQNTMNAIEFKWHCSCGVLTVYRTFFCTATFSFIAAVMAASRRHSHKPTAGTRTVLFLGHCWPKPLTLLCLSASLFFSSVQCHCILQVDSNTNSTWVKVGTESTFVTMWLSRSFSRSWPGTIQLPSITNQFPSSTQSPAVWNSLRLPDTKITTHTNTSDTDEWKYIYGCKHTLKGEVHHFESSPVSSSFKIRPNLIICCITQSYRRPETPSYYSCHDSSSY